MLIPEGPAAISATKTQPFVNCPYVNAKIFLAFVFPPAGSALEGREVGMLLPEVEATGRVGSVGAVAVQADVVAWIQRVRLDVIFAFFGGHFQRVLLDIALGFRFLGGAANRPPPAPFFQRVTLDITLGFLGGAERPPSFFYKLGFNIRYKFYVDHSLNFRLSVDFILKFMKEWFTWQTRRKVVIVINWKLKKFSPYRHFRIISLEHNFRLESGGFD